MHELPRGQGSRPDVSERASRGDRLCPPTGYEKRTTGTNMVGLSLPRLGIREYIRFQESGAKFSVHQRQAVVVFVTDH